MQTSDIIMKFKATAYVRPDMINRAALTLGPNMKTYINPTEYEN